MLSPSTAICSDGAPPSAQFPESRPPGLSGSKRAWPEGRYLTNSVPAKRAFLARCLRSGATPQQKDAAAKEGLFEDYPSLFLHIQLADFQLLRQKALSLIAEASAARVSLMNSEFENAHASSLVCAFDSLSLEQQRLRISKMLSISAHADQLEAPTIIQSTAPSDHSPSISMLPKAKRCLVVFSGRSDRRFTIRSEITAIAPWWIVDEVDILNEPTLHDVTSESVLDFYLSRIAELYYDKVYLACPCSSMSIVSGKRKRSPDHPWGLPDLSDGDQNYIDYHNILIRGTIRIIQACLFYLIDWMCESVAHRGDIHSHAYWQYYETWGFLWDIPEFKDFENVHGAVRILIAHCAYGSVFQKYVQILCSKRIAPRALEIMGNRRCVHAFHKEQAHGVDESGRFRATSTATYPPEMYVDLARVLTGVDSNFLPRTSMHLGSSRPHALGGGAALFNPPSREATIASLRALEPELSEVLSIEPLPSTNLCPCTEWENPPACPHPIPGPLTTSELIPPSAQRVVRDYQSKMTSCLDRAPRGAAGFQAARSLRPHPTELKEQDCTKPAGRGFSWSQPDADVDLWYPIVPSAWPDNSPAHPLRVENFLLFAQLSGMNDWQLLSWVANGFPGAPRLELRLSLGYPHVGALKNVEHLFECFNKDVAKGFITPPRPFPEIWPPVVDCCNVVVQHGKPRLCIDKTIKIGSFSSYNDLIDIADEERRGLRVKMLKVGDFARGIAILLTSGLPVKVCKFDFASFFRCHRKQRVHLFQSMRMIANSKSGGFSSSQACDFGERDAMDHCGRASNCVTWFVKHELSRLDQEYPPFDPTEVAWLNRRAALIPNSSAEARHAFAALWMAICFVDDFGMAVIDMPLHHRDGSPLIELAESTDSDGSSQLVPKHISRAAKYLEVALCIANLLGYGTPAEKIEAMDDWVEYLGVLLDLTIQRRLLSLDKRRRYSLEVARAIAGDKTLPNGLKACEFDFTSRLQHKLLHASSVIPLGRQHLFHIRRCVNSPNRLDWHAVILSSEASVELKWWRYQLLHASFHGLPLASRSEFPEPGDDDHVIEYHDASREFTNPLESGFGAWTVIRHIFYYFAGRWSLDEVRDYSINVLESKTRDMAGLLFVLQARAVGCSATHTTGFNDNTTAENNAERGRVGTALLNAMLIERQQRFLAHNIYARNERVASTENDIADLLSRGSIDAALRFPLSAGLKCVELEIPSSLRAFPRLRDLDLA